MHASSAKNTVALIYGYEPSGHACAAGALGKCFTRQGWKPVFLNLSKDLYPVLGPIVAKTYLKILQKAPALWDYLYDNKSISKATIDLRKAALASKSQKIISRIAGQNINAVVCTHALACAIISASKQAGIEIPVFAVITDFTAHAYWPSKGIEKYFVPDMRTLGELSQNGISAGDIRVSGIPIRDEFLSAPDIYSARIRLGLSAHMPTAIISGGSKGLGNIETQVKTLMPLAEKIQIIVLCGENKNLSKKLGKTAGRHKHMRILGYKDSIADIMPAADIIIGKPGGVTVAESLALGKPWIIFSPLPGQEERNARYLLENGAAQSAQNVEQLRDIARHLLISNDTAVKTMSVNAAKLGKPNACREIVSEIINRTNSLNAADALLSCCAANVN